MSYRLLKDKIVDISLAILLVIMTALTVVFLSVTESKVFENSKVCEISEISPDVSVDTKERCRKLRANAHKD